MSPGEDGPIDDQELGAHSSAEGGHRLTAVQFRDRGDEIPVRLHAQSRSRGQDSASGLIQGVQTRFHDGSETGRDGPGSSAAIGAVGGHEVSSSSTSSGNPSDLLTNQLALGFVERPSTQLDHLVDLLRLEPAQLDHRRGRSDQALQSRRRRVFARCRRDQQRSSGHCGAQIVEQRQRLGVGPMQVVQQQHAASGSSAVSSRSRPSPSTRMGSTLVSGTDGLAQSGSSRPSAAR